MLWTISYEETYVRVVTYAQLLCLVWLITEFARTREKLQSLMVAFCLGAYVPLVGVLSNVIAGVHTKNAFRYSFSDFNANDLALMLVLGMPMAWHLMLRCSSSVRIAAIGYFSLAPVGALLTGSRGASIAGAVSLAIVPLTLPRRSVLFYLAVPILCIATVGIGMTILPPQTWNRIVTVKEEVAGSGTLTGRTVIWSAGLQAFVEKPLLGYGAGAFRAAVEPVLGRGMAPHNALIGVLVEQGVVGFLLFAALLGACAWTIVGLPGPERKLWGVLMLSWLVGVMSLSWQYRKTTWLLFGLLSAQGALAMPRSPVVGARTPTNEERP